MSTLNTYNLKSPDSANTNLALDASGNVAIQAGSASAPSIYVAGDSNTGLYSLGADQLAVTTGGTGRLFIDSSGRVGIGTSSPSYLLHLNGSSNVESRAVTSGASSTAQWGAQNTTGATVVIGAAGSSYSPYGVIGAGNAYVYTGSDLAIATDGANVIKFATGAGISERARIDSSGRLLVGTSSARSNFFRPFSATAAVQVEGTSGNLSTSSVVRNSNDSSPSYFVLGKSRGTANASNTIVQSGDSIGAISFQGTDGGDLTEAARITAEVDGTPGTADMPGRLVFSTTADGASSPTERMRISSSGITSFTSNTVSFRTTENNISIQSDRTSGTTFAFISGRGNSGADLNLIVWNNGNIQNANNSYGAISDIKLKENIVDAASQWDDLKALQVRNYNFKEGQTHTQIGLVAQEVELVSPGLVTESPDRDAEGNDLGTVTKSVNYSVLYMKAVKALQEAMERIETLEAKVAALESA